MLEIFAFCSRVRRKAKNFPRITTAYFTQKTESTMITAAYLCPTSRGERWKETN